MVDRPVWLRLHPRQIIETAVPSVEHKALTVEVHREQLADPTLVSGTDGSVIAKLPRIRMHQYMGHRDVAKLLLVDVAQAHIVVGDAIFHVSLALHRHTIRIADVVHQIVIVLASEIGTHHIETERIQLSEIVIVAVEYVDVFQPIAVRPHLPEARILHLAEIARHKELRIIQCKLLGIGHHRRLEVEILHDLLCEDCRIAPPVLKHEVEGTRRQIFSLPIVVQNIALADRDIALPMQFRQMATQLILSDQRARIAHAIHAKIRNGDKAVILPIGIRRRIGDVRLQREEQIDDNRCHDGEQEQLRDNADALVAVLFLCKILLPRKIHRQRRGGLLFLHPASTAFIFFAVFLSCLRFCSSTSAAVMRVPHVVFQKVTHATGICHSSTAS